MFRLVGSVVFVVFLLMSGDSSAGALPQKVGVQPAVKTVKDLRGASLLVRNAIIALNQASLTGNYSVFRDLAAPSLRESMTVARLSEYFKPLRDSGVDMSGALLYGPQFRKPPVIIRKKLLWLEGYVPTRPKQIEFKLVYQKVKGKWRFLDVDIRLKSAAVAALQRSKKAGAAKQAKKTAGKKSVGSAPRPAAGKRLSPAGMKIAGSDAETRLQMDWSAALEAWSPEEAVKR